MASAYFANQTEHSLLFPGSGFKILSTVLRRTASQRSEQAHGFKPVFRKRSFTGLI